MPIKSPFALIYDPEVKRHLKTIDRKYYSLIQRTIEKQLSHEPETETRNRKPLRRPSVFGTAWELRFGPDNRFRVFIELTSQAVKFISWQSGLRSVIDYLSGKRSLHYEDRPRS